MKSYYALTPQDLGEMYVQSRAGYLPDTAEKLMGDVRRWLRAEGLDHRLNEASAIASAALSVVIDRQPDPQSVQQPEEVAWANDIMQGTTAREIPQGSELYSFLTGR